MAGSVAALTLARQGLATTLVRSGPGATGMCWGTIDVASASPDRSGLPWRDPVRDQPLGPAERVAYLLNSRPAHPYGVLFPERDVGRAVPDIKQALDVLSGELRPHGVTLVGSLDESRLLANVRGAIRVADFALAEAAAGDLGRGEGAVVVDVPGLAGFSPNAVARALRAELDALGVPGPSIRVARLDLPQALAELAASPARLAGALDDPSAAEALAAKVAPLGGEGRLILFPPILGLLRTGALRATLEDSCGGRVAELLGAPPWSPAGLRLDRALGAALEGAGVLVRRARAESIGTPFGRADTVVVADEDGHESLPADAVVLATGRFVGGGLREEEEAFGEALLGLPVYDDRGRRLDGGPARRHLRRRFGDPQPLFTAGVRVDGRLRPLGAGGDVAAPNLVAAGEIVSGFDPALQRTGLGFALLSGRRAGLEAALLASEAVR